MCAQNHTIAVDYFALGVMTYEFMMGKRPYLGKSRKEIKEHIMSKQVQVTKTDIMEGWTLESADFINKLLQRKPANRLGLRGAQEVKDHVWFKGYPWKDLYERKLSPLFVPKSGDNIDKRYLEQPDNIGQNTKENYENLIRRETIQNFFRKFTFISNDEENTNQNTVKKDNTSTVRKFTNPHMSLSSSVESTRTTKPNNAYNEKGFPSIENKMYNSKASTSNLLSKPVPSNLSSSASKSNLVFKVLKKSNSAINYNYIKNKPKTGISSYYFQN